MSPLLFYFGVAIIALLALLGVLGVVVLALMGYTAIRSAVMDRQRGWAAGVLMGSLMLVGLIAMLAAMIRR
jgi:hypothetical protein